MPARILPAMSELERMLRSGMTHAEIAEAVSRSTGRQVRRSTVSAAIHRAGISSPAKKYPEEIPWTVKEKHLTHYAARMLRILGRRNKGIRNSEEMDAKLDSWLELLKREHSVVVYVPETEAGFFYIDGDFNEKGIPIIAELDLEGRV